MTTPLQNITMKIGQVVDVTLDSMAGSTGYGWELASLEGVNLCDITVVPPRAIGITQQVFSFRATAAGTGKASFVLAAPWKIEEPAQTVEYTFTVAEASEDDLLKLKGFTTQATVREPGTTIMYAAQAPLGSFDNSIDECCSDECIPQVMKYNSPPPLGMKYNSPRPVMKYNIPQPVMKYNIPQPTYNIPPMMRYNYPFNDCDC